MCRGRKRPMGLYQRFGSSAGSLVPVVIIPSDTAPAGTNIRVTDFGVASGVGSADSIVMLELSTDGFVGSVVEVSRVEIPTSGTVYKTFGRPILVKPGNSVRARFSQGTAGTISVELFGETVTLQGNASGINISDI